MSTSSSPVTDKDRRIALGAVCPEGCDTPCETCLSVARRKALDELTAEAQRLGFYDSGNSQ